MQHNQIPITANRYTKRERIKKRQSDRQTDRQRDSDRYRYRQREGERQTDRETHRQRQRDRQRQSRWRRARVLAWTADRYVPGFVPIARFPGGVQFCADSTQVLRMRP